ncbi:hypothetical protein D3C77_601470 [compost metagenome]
MLQHMRRSPAQERLHGIMPVAAHDDHVRPAVADKLGNCLDRRPLQEVPALQRDLVVVAQAVERRPLCGPHAAIEAGHGHRACAEVGNMGLGRVAHMQQVQFSVALQGQRMGAVDHLLIQVFASAMAVQIHRGGNLPGQG